MSFSPGQHSSTSLNIPGNISRMHSDTSIMSTASFQSIPDSIPEANHSLSPPQLANLMGSPSSTPNSPHLSSRPSSASKGKGMMKKKFMRKTALPQTSIAISPLSHPPPTVPEDSLGDTQVSVHQANRAMFTRMLKRSFPPKKMRSLRRTKRRIVKQYHSDDGYTSDPGILREEDDDETDNDPDVHDVRRISQIKDLQSKIEKARRTMGTTVADGEDASSIQDTDEYVEAASEKPNNRLGLRLHIGKSRSYHEQQRRKIDKWVGQVKELQEGGTLDSEVSRGARFKVRIEDGLKGIAHRRFMKGLTNAGSKFRRKRAGAAPGEVIDDEDDDQLLEEDDIGQSEEVLLAVNSQNFEPEPEEEEILVDVMREEQEALRLTSENCVQDIRMLKEQHQDSLRLIVEKLDQERERGERLEGQLNDITELHQHEMSDLRAQLAQIENSAIMKGQELEEAVELFNSKFDKVDAHVMTLMDSSVVPDVKRRLMRGPMAAILSFLLVLLAFIFKMVSIIRAKPLSHLILVVVVALFLGLWWYNIIGFSWLLTTQPKAPPTLDTSQQTTEPPHT